MTVPKQKPGQSEQVVCTPPEFLDAVRSRFGIIQWDLAALRDNNVVQDGSSYFGPDQRIPEYRDALTQRWWGEGLCWCNPPFGAIGPWVEKAAREQANVLMLLPASVGSEWFALHVHRKAYVLALRKRLKFVGHKDAYPKDLMLVVYGSGLNGFDTWDWSVKP